MRAVFHILVWILGLGLFANSAQAANVLALGLDEGSGAVTFVDSSGNGNNGSCTSGTCPQSGLAGMVNRAAVFDGVNDFIQIPGTASLRPASTVAVSAYIKTASAPAEGGEIVSMGDNYTLKVLANGNARFFYYAGSNWIGVDTAGLNLLDNQIHHLVGQKTASALEIYVDGVPRASVPASGTISYTLGTNLMIGRHANGVTTRHFNGMIDEVQVYHRPLSASQIAALALKGAVVMALGLDEPSGAVIFRDNSGTNNHGSCSSATCPQAGATGKASAAAVFNGVDDYILIPGNSSLRPASTVAVSAYIKTATAPAQGGEIVSMGDNYTLKNPGQWQCSILLLCREQLDQCRYGWPESIGQ
jgi:hypothetical protein